MLGVRVCLQLTVGMMHNARACVGPRLSWTQALDPLLACNSWLRVIVVWAACNSGVGCDRLLAERAITNMLP